MWAPEIKYVLRTLVRLAGYPYHFMWAARGDACDVYYGLQSESVSAPLAIQASERDFSKAPQVEPRRLVLGEELSFLDFDGTADTVWSGESGRLTITNDIVFGSYWLLSGAREPSYPHDRWGNLDLDGSFFVTKELATRPIVSAYGAFLREFFRKRGNEPLEFPWETSGSQSAFGFSHDVDYPQMIRWVECFRLLKARGLRGLRSIGGVLSGSNHFWKFADWVEFARSLDTRPAFYFMARRGSPLQYALGTPDAFYDVRKPAFRELFRVLTKEGCEVGLHASFHAHRSASRLRMERELLEEAASVSVEGNRHHFWHLDPADPNETLRRHEEAGLKYDSSLAFEYYPGFRRGICHPFHVFHPGERRELDILQLPPAWMDNHFDSRLKKNRITDPEHWALQLVKTAQKNHGVVIVDYHVRGMNRDFFPRWGAWLEQLLGPNLRSLLTFLTPREIMRRYLDYEHTLESHSNDQTPVANGNARLSKVAPEHLGPVESVGFLEPEESGAWEDFVANHDARTIYHTLAWREVTEEGFGHRSYYLRAIDSERRIRGVLPLFLVRGVFGRRLVSVPMRDRGGVLAQDSRTASHLIGRATQLSRDLHCRYLELRSLDELDPAIVAEHALRTRRYWVTTRIDLTAGVDQLWKALDRDAIRWAIGKARREGVRAGIDNRPEAVAIFHDLFVRTRSAMGIPPFPRTLFEAMGRHLLEKGHAQLFFVWKGDEPIHAMLTFLSGDTFLPAYAAPQNAWRKCYPNDFLFWHTIEWAAQNGFRWYDFGADSPKQSGLLWFKQKWGGRPHPMHSAYSINGQGDLPEYDSSSSSYALARRVWKWLPQPVSRGLGAWLTCQLS